MIYNVSVGLYSVLYILYLQTNFTISVYPIPIHYPFLYVFRLSKIACSRISNIFFLFFFCWLFTEKHMLSSFDWLLIRVTIFYADAICFEWRLKSVNLKKIQWTCEKKNFLFIFRPIKSIQLNNNLDCTNMILRCFWKCKFNQREKIIYEFNEKWFFPSPK